MKLIRFNLLINTHIRSRVRINGRMIHLRIYNLNRMAKLRLTFGFYVKWM